MFDLGQRAVPFACRVGAYAPGIDQFKAAVEEALDAPPSARGACAFGVPIRRRSRFAASPGDLAPSRGTLPATARRQVVASIATTPLDDHR
ncbi:Hypothetical protein A7982_06155 [Minicystis rosea]|nr:Hypothetical protein A7982_06155 [Minicystis rosea]